MYKIKRFFTKLRQASKGFVVAFKDEPWDFVYMWRILDAKLEQMQRYFEKNVEFADANRQSANEIGLCRSLLSEYLKEDYDGQYVNVKNANRFLGTFELHFCQEGEWDDIHKEILRQRKLLHAITLMLETCSEGWWD